MRASHGAAHAPADPERQAAHVAYRLGFYAAAAEPAIELGVLPWPAGVVTRANAQWLKVWFRTSGTGSTRDTQVIERINSYLIRNPKRWLPLGQTEGHNVLGWRELALDGP